MILNKAAIPRSNASLGSAKPNRGTSQKSASGSRIKNSHPTESKKRLMSARIDTTKYDDLNKKASPKRKMRSSAGSQKQ